MSIEAKICGLKDESCVDASIEAGASLLGFVFYSSSSRCVNKTRALKLTDRIPKSIQKVGLFVDPKDELLDSIVGHVPLDIIQLHGRESVSRVEKIRSKYGLKVMKAISVTDSDNLNLFKSYQTVVDMLLFDSLPPKSSKTPGGNGKAFDWDILKKTDIAVPWVLAGGINRKNVAKAVQITGAKIVDVSSGVESAPGQKDPNAIKKFLDVVKTL